MLHAVRLLSNGLYQNLEEKQGLRSIALKHVSGTIKASMAFRVFVIVVLRCCPIFQKPAYTSSGKPYSAYLICAGCLRLPAARVGATLIISTHSESWKKFLY
ncbi:hypothetical protein CQ054_21140 [Ochrobactrum sp. MYb29]|nr:hypothetical protein CWE02_09800 [Brucella pituitosa]PRA80220.1 hypothetical protein CQ054_21140 [Ochrobactrum sp. MYb29]